MRTFRRLLFLTLTVFIMSFCTACSSNESIYNDVQTQIELQNLVEGKSNSEQGVSLTLPQRWYNICVTAKQYAPFIMVGSVLAGLAVMIIFRSDKGIKRWALFLLILGIPFVTFLVTFGICYLYGFFNF